MVLLTTSFGVYVQERKVGRKRVICATEDADLAIRFKSADEALEWAGRKLKTHECLPSYARLRVEQ